MNWAHKEQLVCNELVYQAYKSVGYDDFPYRYKALSDGKRPQVEWFKEKNWWYTDPNIGQKGDLIFFSKTKGGHVAMIADARINETTGKTEYLLIGAGVKGGTGYHGGKNNWQTAKEWAVWIDKDLQLLGIGSPDALMSKWEALNSALELLIEIQEGKYQDIE